ncbi:Acetamidase [compost metagenome]
MFNNLNRFSTDAFPGELRAAAWVQTLGQIGLSCDFSSAERIPLHGCAAVSVSSHASVFAKLNGSPQVLHSRDDALGRRNDVVLIVALLEGQGQVSVGPESARMSVGDIFLLNPHQDWRLELKTNFTAILVELKEAGFLARLMRSGASDLNKVTTAHGAGGISADFLYSIAEHFDGLSPEDLGQMEASLTSLLIAGMAQHAEVGESGEHEAEHSTSVQLGHLRRVCRSIENRLADPEVSIGEIARIENLSARYIQKLFAGGDTTFGEYVKKRRLDRCRNDLANSALRHLTICELCFRWGFNDAANFSRAFNLEFGISPKAYRASSGKQVALHLQRGRPASSAAVTSEKRRHNRKLATLAAPGEPTDLREKFVSILSEIADYDVSALPLGEHEQLPANDEAALAAGAQHHYIPVSDKTVHWGYFSKSIKPVVTINSGDSVTIETLTQHAYDDYERMIKGDPGAESVFHWDANGKSVDRRGSGPLDSSIYGRGAGEGFGVHICTGPVYVQDAEPGDVLEIRILDIHTRPAADEQHAGKSFGSNAASWWGFHYHDLLTEPKPREVVTIYEIEHAAHHSCAKAVYNFRWTPQTDPYGVRHDTIDYPGIPVDHGSIVKNYGVLKNARIPIRPHFGVMAVAPVLDDEVDSVPPGSFGGNLDNWRAAKGATLFLPVAVPGALFSVGDPHASQGDSELCGTAIECSLTGEFQLILHKKKDLAGSFLDELDHPFLESEEDWVIQGLSYANHLVELGANAQADIYKKASLDMAMRDAFRKTRRYLMTAHALNEDEAISLISVAVDFGITQVVNGNWGVHAVIKKSIFCEPE